MAEPIIQIKVRGLQETKAFISSLPKHLRGIATKAMAEWFIGDGRRGLKRYPPYKYITRRMAYGKTFVSDRQRRYVMARIREGSIAPGVPHRTGNYQRGWQMINKGVQTQIVNNVPYAGFVGGDEQQARLNKRVGWNTVSEIITSNMKGAVRAAHAAIREYINRRR